MSNAPCMALLYDWIWSLNAAMSLIFIFNIISFVGFRRKPRLNTLPFFNSSSLLLSLARVNWQSSRDASTLCQRFPSVPVCAVTIFGFFVHAVPIASAALDSPCISRSRSSTVLSTFLESSTKVYIVVVTYNLKLDHIQQMQPCRGGYHVAPLDYACGRSRDREGIHRVCSITLLTT